MRSKLISAALLLSVFSSAYAKEIIKSGRWVLDDRDPKDPKANCMAYTSEKIGKVTYYLEVIKQKNSQGLTEIILQQDGQGAANSWVMTLNNGSSYAFAKYDKAASGKGDLLWNIPQNSQDIFDQLDNKPVKFKPADGSKDIGLKFDESGFRKIREKMAEACNNGRPLIDSEFEREFVKQDLLNPQNISLENAVELRRLTAEAYKVHLSLGDNASEMSALKNRFSKELSESNSLAALIDKLTNSDIPTTIRNAQNNDALEAQKRSDLQSITSDISSQNAKIVAAQQVLTSAQAQVTPLQAEHDVRQSNARNTRSQNNDSINRLNQIDSGIANANARVNQLSNEAGNLQNQSNAADNELRRPGGGYDDARRASEMARMFDPRREADQRLRGDRQYQMDQNNLNVLKQQFDIASRAMNDATARVRVAEATLRACQSTTAFIQGDSFRVPAQSRPDRDGQGRPGGEDRGNRGPGRPGGGQPGQPSPQPQPEPQPQPAPQPAPAPTPAPAPQAADCTQQAEALRQAKIVESNMQGGLRSSEQNLRQVSDRMDQSERRARQDAEEKRNFLNVQAMNASRRVEGLENQIRANNARIDQISRADIPNQQNILNSLQNERPGVQAIYDQTAPLANQLESELANFEARTNWNAKVQAVNSATQDLSQKQVQLQQMTSYKASTENIIANCQSERVRLNNELAARQTQKTSSEARLVQVKESLKPFEASKADIESRRADLKNQYAGLSVQFENNLPR